MTCPELLQGSEIKPLRQSCESLPAGPSCAGNGGGDFFFFKERKKSVKEVLPPPQHHHLPTPFPVAGSLMSSSALVRAWSSTVPGLLERLSLPKRRCGCVLAASAALPRGRHLRTHPAPARCDQPRSATKRSLLQLEGAPRSRSATRGSPGRLGVSKAEPCWCPARTRIRTWACLVLSATATFLGFS